MKNRNIITRADAEELKKLTAEPPAYDDYLDRLLKYVPIEVMGVYLVIESILQGMYADRTALAVWLGLLLVVGILLTFIYVKFYLKISRWLQIFMSVLAFAIWVSTLGGWFETLDWWNAGWGSIAVVLFAVLVKIIRLPSLPVETLKEMVNTELNNPPAGQVTAEAKPGSP